jgi:hypothetical protein
MFYLFAVGPKNTKVPHEYGLELVSLGLIAVRCGFGAARASSLTCLQLKGMCAANSSNPHSIPEKDPRSADLLTTKVRCAVIPGSLTLNV